MELVTVNNGKIEIAQNTLNGLRLYQEQKKKMDKVEKQLKKEIIKAMEDNGIKSFENDDVKITYIEPITRTVVDQKALKEAGLFGEFSKETETASTVRITWR